MGGKMNKILDKIRELEIWDFVKGIVIMFLIGYVCVSCTESYSQKQEANYEKAKTSAYEQGYDEGYSEGYNRGYDEGYNKAIDEIY